MTARSQSRRDRIYQEVVLNDYARVGELAERLGVSTETIRRDLDAMESEGLIEREHGIARVPVEKSRLMMDVRKDLGADDKSRVAAKSAELVSDGDVVFVDGGTTGIEVARHLVGRAGLTVVTNGLECALVCCRAGHATYMLGGKVDRRDESTLGGSVQDQLDRMVLDIALVGTDGVEGADGPTSAFSEDMDMKLHILRRARKTVLMIDSLKFGFGSVYQYARWEELDAVVVSDPDEKNRALLSAVPEVILA